MSTYSTVWRTSAPSCPPSPRRLASARRQSAALRVENRKLLEEVRRLRRQRGESSL